MLVHRHFSHLRFPQLFVISAAFFLFDLLIPDMIPFVDEILLGLLTLLLGSLRRPLRAPRS
jgi:hypothetical protein